MSRQDVTKTLTRLARRFRGSVNSLLAQGRGPEMSNLSDHIRRDIGYDGSCCRR